ncbi:hypothetical protein BJ912DRAFT_1058016 [Pholiota molesta]|nr:hypothetical protein BJ912DRAFT_1058016 [Pholiota molesta]
MGTGMGSDDGARATAVAPPDEDPEPLRGRSVRGMPCAFGYDAGPAAYAVSALLPAGTARPLDAGIVPWWLRARFVLAIFFVLRRLVHILHDDGSITRHATAIPSPHKMNTALAVF